MVDEITADFPTESVECRATIDAASQIDAVGLPNTSDNSDVTTLLNAVGLPNTSGNSDVITLMNAVGLPNTSDISDVTTLTHQILLDDAVSQLKDDESRRASSFEVPCETRMKSGGKELSFTEAYEKLLFNFEPSQPCNSLEPFADNSFTMYTELRNDLWDDIFPTDNKFTKGHTQHLATSLNSLQEMIVGLHGLTTNKCDDLNTLNSEPLSLRNQQNGRLKSRTKLLDVSLYNTNYKRSYSNNVSNIDAHPLTTGEWKSYETLNDDVWNEIFPVKTQNVALHNQSMQEIFHQPPSTLLSDQIKMNHYSSCANQLPILKDCRPTAKKELEFELPTKKTTSDKSVHKFQTENHIDTAFDYPIENNANMITSTVANLGEVLHFGNFNDKQSRQSLITHLENTLHKNCVEDEYNFINEYAYITLDDLQESVICEQCNNSSDEVKSSPGVQITSTHEFVVNWINTKVRQVSRVKCRWISGIVFVSAILLLSVVVVIALFLNNRLNDELNFLHNPRLLGVLSVGRYLTGVTVLDRQLFVVRQRSSEVNVYDTNSLTFTRNITITGSLSLLAIVSSQQCNCLFISDPEQNLVYRYNLYDNVTSSWLVGGPCYGLSLTTTHNVLVTVWNTKPIKEYTPDGGFVREISLDSSVEHPVHSLPLSSGQFVVAHGLGGLLHRVCIVDTSGSITQFYGGSRGSGVGQLDTPTNLAVDSHDNVYIADRYNKRVVWLSPSLTRLGYITIPGHELSQPQALHLDLLNLRLYIAEHASNGRIFILTP